MFFSQPYKHVIWFDWQSNLFKLEHGCTHKYDYHCIFSVQLQNQIDQYPNLCLCFIYAWKIYNLQNRAFFALLDHAYFQLIFYFMIKNAISLDKYMHCGMWNSPHDGCKCTVHWLMVGLGCLRKRHFPDKNYQISRILCS